jgi:hypothetical protein
MKFGSWYYPKGDERQEPVPVAEYERVAKPTPITGKDLAEYRKAYADHTFREVEGLMVRARYKLRAPDQHAGIMAHYLKAYAEIVRALEFEPDPFTTPDSPALTELFWDLKGIRAAMERGEPVGRIDRLIGDLIDVILRDEDES